MSATARFEFHGRDEALKIYNTGGSIVKFLGLQNEICPLLGSKIKFVKKLGQGNFGTVFLLEIEGMNDKEYVAKEMDGATLDEISVMSILGIPQKKGVKPPNKVASFDVLLKKLGEMYPNIPSWVFTAFNEDRDYAYNESIKFPYGRKFRPCLTTESTKYETFYSAGTVQHHLDRSYIIVPKGSLLCDSNEYSEYIISLMCGEMYRKKISINFIDTFGFATCPKEKVIKNYVFMERINSTLRDVFTRLNKLSKEVPAVRINMVVDNLLFQTLFGVACLQSQGIVHGDLHADNIFIENITAHSQYANQQILENMYFHYRVDGVDLYLPYIPYIVKIGDFGLSVKYTGRIIGDKQVLEDGYDQEDGKGPWLPNWFSASYDALFITRWFFTIYPENPTVRKIFSELVDRSPKKASNKKFRSNGRPKLKFVHKRDSEINIKNILKNIQKYHIVKSGVKYATFGEI